MSCRPATSPCNTDLVRERSLITAYHDLHALAGRHMEGTPTYSPAYTPAASTSLLSAMSGRGLILAQREVDAKTNEITVFPPPARAARPGRRRGHLRRTPHPDRARPLPGGRQAGALHRAGQGKPSHPATTTEVPAVEGGPATRQDPCHRPRARQIPADEDRDGGQAALPARGPGPAQVVRHRRIMATGKVTSNASTLSPASPRIRPRRARLPAEYVSAGHREQGPPWQGRDVRRGRLPSTPRERSPHHGRPAQPRNRRAPTERPQQHRRRPPLPRKRRRPPAHHAPHHVIKPNLPRE